MVGEGVQVQAELPVPPVPERVEVAPAGEHQRVVLPGGHRGHAHPGQAGQGLGRGSLEAPAAEAELAVAALPPAVDCARGRYGEAVVAATPHLHHGLRQRHQGGQVRVPRPRPRPRPRPQPQLAAVPLPEGVELPLAGDQRAVVVAAADVHHLHNIASVET